MTFDYCCSKNLSGIASWKGQVSLITTVNPYELTVTARNSSFAISRTFFRYNLRVTWCQTADRPHPPSRERCSHAR